MVKVKAKIQLFDNDRKPIPQEIYLTNESNMYYIDITVEDKTIKVNLFDLSKCIKAFEAVLQ